LTTTVIDTVPDPSEPTGRSTDGLILVLHDTTEFSFRREQPELVGSLGIIAGRKDDRGRPQLYTTCGILMLARASDPPPGNLVMWRGLSRLTDIVLGFEAAKLVGN
jgi:hypothetical protein